MDAQVQDVLKNEKSALAFMRERGLQVFEMENPKAFSDKMEAVYKEAADRIGADLIEQVRAFS